VIHATVRRAVFLVACGGTGLALLTGCSSSNDATKPATSTQGTPSSSAAKTSAGSAASAAAGECTEVSILAALPAGSIMDKYQCAIASPTMWAAARVNPGPRVFFLQTKSGAWKVSTAKQMCGKPPAGLPKEIQAFCPKA
jgi:hypothetical protein